MLMESTMCWPTEAVSETLPSTAASAHKRPDDSAVKVIRCFFSRSISRRRAMNIDLTMNVDLAGIRIPDSKLAREIMELVQDTEPPLLFHHSSRVYYWGALAGKRRGLRFDPELLYAGAMFHDIGLTHQHSSADERFEVDGANGARGFLPGTIRVDTTV
jgi:HD-GYP domain-containing protein (c-di-GMP phosphodiesterase class II)